jgi:hypothetical protein
MPRLDPIVRDGRVAREVAPRSGARGAKLKPVSREARAPDPKADKSVEKCAPDCGLSAEAWQEDGGNHRARRGVSYLYLKDKLDGEGEVGSVKAPNLEELASETHWLTNAPVLGSPAVAVICGPRVQKPRLLAALEEDARGNFAQRYAMHGFGDQTGSVERCIWVVDPQRGFNDLRSIVAGTCLHKAQLDVVCTGEWGPLSSWLDLLDEIIPAVADFDGLERKQREQLVARAESERRLLTKRLRSSVVTGYLVRACLNDDGPAVREALEAGALPGAADATGLTGEVAAKIGGAAERVLDEWWLEHHSHAEFVDEMEKFLQCIPLEEFPEDPSIGYETVTEHVEVSKPWVDAFSLPEDDPVEEIRSAWMDRLLRKYPEGAKNS